MRVALCQSPNHRNQIVLLPFSVALCQSIDNRILPVCSSFVLFTFSGSRLPDSVFICFVSVFGCTLSVCRQSYSSFVRRLFCLRFRLHFVSLQIILFFVRSLFVLLTFSVSRPPYSVFDCFVCAHKYDSTRDK